MKCPITTGIAALLITTAVQAGTVLYVDDGAPAGGDGLTWNTAHRSLQDALAAAAASGGTVNRIHVAQGTYLPDHDASNPEGTGPCFLPGGGCPDPDCEAAVCAVLPTCCDIAWDGVCASLALDLCADAMAATFQLINRVEVMGGYAGIGELDPDVRDIELYPSILSGDLARNDAPGFVNNDENSLHVVSGSGTDGTAVLDGFTITAGHARGAGWPALDTSGAGILNDAGSPTVTTCLVTGNLAQEYGGGMVNFSGSSPRVTNCVFTNNNSADWAGGMFNWTQCSPTVTHCTFGGNTATYRGGGMVNFDNSNPTVENCEFTGNTAGQGGAMDNHTDSNPTIENCEFTGNTAQWGGAIYTEIGSNATIQSCTFDGNASDLNGGAVFSNASNPTITDCAFTQNTAENFGGAMMNHNYSETVVANCVFFGNQAGSRGGAVRSGVGASPTFANCTFSQNSAVESGGALSAGTGIQNTAGNTLLVNCVLWENTAPQGSELALTGHYPVEVTVTYSDVEGGEAGVLVEPGFVLNWGVGNIDADPLFADADGRLSPGSPCVDAGSNPAVPAGITTDLDGNPRFVDDPCREDTGLGDPLIVDMGAYEFPGRSCDLDGDGVVGITDFLELLAEWGACPDPCPPSCPADFDGDCIVGITDFLLLLGEWG
jgi:predicted outer membrane repeat protein